MYESRFINAKCRITLKTVDSIYRAIRWAVDRNRNFSIVTNNLVLGWSMDVDVLPEENIEEMDRIFNNEPKTEAS